MLCLREIATRSTGEELAQAASTYLGEQRRRSSRLEQTSPLIIRGVDLLGQPFEERTATQNLSFQGCRYASKHHLPKNTWVTLEAPSGDSRGDAVCVRARVAWIQRPRTLRELFQVGVELEKPRNIWNVEFPPNDWSSEKTPELSIVRAPSADEEPLVSEQGVSLEDYLRRATIVRIQEPSRLESSEWNEVSGTLAGQLRHECLQESTGTRIFYESLLKEFERNRAAVKQEISFSVEQGVAAQFGSFRQEVRDALESEWAEKFRHAQLDVQALRKEVRADIEANLVR